MKRRSFLAGAALAGVAGPAGIGRSAASGARPLREGTFNGGSIVVSTWNFQGANEAAHEALERGLSLLDAVEAGIRVPESDPAVTSVGIGGFPDRDGRLTLDASIMEGTGRCGAVVFVEGVDHPISLARAVMERSPHVLLAGEGAERFALEQGFSLRKELTPRAREAWEEWKRASGYRPAPLGKDNHDTIGLLVLRDGSMAGGCSTSGAAWKLHGRVGDSPIVGAGLFVDDEVGAATATGLGETVIRVAGSALVVELMRQGFDPGEACREAARRIAAKQPEHRGGKGFLVGFLALRKDGETGGYGIGPGFEYALTRDGRKTVVRAPFQER